MDAEPGGQVDRLPPAHVQLHGARALRIPDAPQPVLLVELRLARRDRTGHHDRDRRGARHALHAERGAGVQLRRNDHARRELRVAVALPAHERRVGLLPDRLHPYFPRALLRLVQGAARAAVDHRHLHPADHDGDGLHGLRAALGPDELLGRDRDHQPVLGHPGHRQPHRHLAVGRVQRRQPDAQPVLQPALFAAVRDLAPWSGCI